MVSLCFIIEPFFTAGYILGFVALEACFIIHSTAGAIALLRHAAIPADVELLAVIWVWEGRVRQGAAVGASHLAVWAREPVVQHVLLAVETVMSVALARPGAGTAGVIVDEARRAGHFVGFSVHTVYELITHLRIRVPEITVGSWTSVARLWFLQFRAVSALHIGGVVAASLTWISVVEHKTVWTQLLLWFTLRTLVVHVTLDRVWEVTSLLRTTELSLDLLLTGEERQDGR